MNAGGTPEPEVAMDAERVAALLREQHEDLAGLPVRLADAGWDNWTFRLGDDRCVRLPRRAEAAALIEREQAWLPEIAQRLPLRVPTPEREGRPGRGYPWRWSVLPWLPGDTLDRAPLDPAEASPWVEVLVALHVDAPSEAPDNPWRGVPLARRADTVEARLARLAEKTTAITPAIRVAWQRALAAPPATDRRWLHGDLHPRNVLSVGGRLTGIIDWGDVTAGDVATDLASLWMLFEDHAIRRAALDRYATRRGLGVDTARALVDRAVGWAIFFGASLLDTGLVDHPTHARLGATTLERVSAAERGAP